MILRNDAAARVVERLAMAGIKEVGFEADRPSCEAGEACAEGPVRRASSPARQGDMSKRCAR